MIGLPTIEDYDARREDACEMCGRQLAAQDGLCTDCMCESGECMHVDGRHGTTCGPNAHTYWED